jgi:hypothetical protein
MDPMSALSTLLSLATLYVMAVWLWRDTAIDLVRQRLFALRDEIFNHARHETHGITFQSAAYRQLRTTINGHIRFAPSFDFLSALLMAFLVRQEAGGLRLQYEQQWQTGLAELPADGQATLVQTRLRLHFLVGLYSLLSVPHLMALAGIPIVTVLLARFAIRALWQRTFAVIPGSIRALRRRVEIAVDTAAFDEGCLA